MILTTADLESIDKIIECLFRDGMNDGDIGYLHRSNQIDLILRMKKYIQERTLRETPDFE